MYKEYRAKPSRSEPSNIGKLPAHLVTFTDRSGREPMHWFFLYIAYSELIYQFAGIAPERYRTAVRETARSFRPLTADELASIRETRLRIVSARTGETLPQLSKRTGNKWDPKTTAVINGVKVDRPLKGGQLIKIGVPQRYRSR